jgi:sulfoxide reductase heme-binding subunit YedZ
MASTNADITPGHQRLRRILFGEVPARRALYILGVLPGLWTFYLGATDQLGADPVATFERELGEWGLRFLIAGLAISPLRRLGGPSLIRYRRAVGLLAFYYALAHLAVYLTFDRQLDFASIWGDIVKRPYITVGMISFAILLPLAVTSNNAAIRRVGSGAWQRLHKWVYAAAALAALHFILLSKVWVGEPLVYAGLVVVLLGFRGVETARRRFGLAPARRSR